VNSWQQAQDGMRFRSAHALWFARMCAAVREGRTFDEPEPKLEDFMKPSGYDAAAHAAAYPGF
jgi:hypothetical protein